MRHVVIGGGIAGVCCVEELSRLRPSDSVTLISSSTVLKGIDSVIRITRTIEEVSVRERDLHSLQHPNLTVLQAVVTAIDTHNRVVHVEPGGAINYDRLCVACGARPKVLGFQHDAIVTLRDTQSVQDFANKLTSARRIAVVGNGGIALELVGAVRDIEVVWIMKHEHIGDAFFDVDAAEFLLEELQHQQPVQQQQQQQEQQRQQDGSAGSTAAQPTLPQQSSASPNSEQQQQQQVSTVSLQQQQQQQQEGSAEACQAQQPSAAGPGAGAQAHTGTRVAAAPTAPTAAAEAAAAAAAAGGTLDGHAAGPKWVDSLPKGRLPANVRLERHALVVGASSSPHRRQEHQAAAAFNSNSSLAGHAAANGSCSASSWPLYLQLSTGDEVGVDLLVQAIGVEASTAWLPAELARAPDGGILVGSNLESVSTPGVFAAGDCCTVDPKQQSPHWFQMRLWTQARLMGTHAAACMAGADNTEVFNFSFELFTHVTRFLGRKVVLLGLYNGQKLHEVPCEDVVMYSRVLDAGTPEATFVRVLLLRGKMQGAVLIGETELEETFENLILDGLDLSQYGPGLLDPDIELDHVFD